MCLTLLPLLFLSVAADSFLYLHPANPEYHPRDVFPQQKSAPRGKIRDLPQSGIIYLDRIKPIDPFVRAFGSNTVDRKAPVDIPPSQEIQKESLTPINHISIEEKTPEPTTQSPLTTTTQVSPADLSNDDVDALDNLLNSFKSPSIDLKAGEEQKKPARLVTLRGTKVAGSASMSRYRHSGRLVRLNSVKSTATVKNSPEFDPWERIEQ